MTIRHLTIFVAVAETGKMSSAAAKFYISQPTVSQTIKELEEHYGVLLFDRISKKLYITEAGKNLLTYAKLVVDQFNQLEDNMFTGFNEKLRIGATVTVGSCILSSVINQFKEKIPDVDTFSYVNNTKVIEDKLLNSELDVGIVEGRIKNHDLITLPVMRDSLVIVCNKNHRFAGKKKVSIKELEKENFVMREEGSGTRELFEHYMSKHGAKIKVSWEVSCPNAIKKAVMNNNCLAAISERLVEDEINTEEFYTIKCNDNSLERSFLMVYYKNKIFSESMKTLCDILKSFDNGVRKKDIASGILIHD